MNKNSIVNIVVAATVLLVAALSNAQQQTKTKKGKPKNPAQNTADAKNKQTGRRNPFEDPEFAKYAIYAKTAPRADSAPAVSTSLPLKLKKRNRIALVGNTLLDRAQDFGYLETLLHQRFPQLELVVRNLSWSADTPDLQPRPANFADLEQHLAHEKIDVVFAAFGFNESFAGPSGVKAFEASLTKFVSSMRTKAFNGQVAPQIVLISPIANENIAGVSAADLNNANLALYTKAVQRVAAASKVGFADVFTPTQTAMARLGSDLTINGCHLSEDGYALFAKTLFEKSFGGSAPAAFDESIREVVLDKNRQYFRRYRPLNTFYYTGGRNKSYGYLDFLPAMRNFDMLVENREKRIWQIAQGHKVAEKIDDSNIPALPPTKESRGANRWITAKAELKEFKVDPRFDVTLFAGEEEFPDIAAPIQMRWDSLGRLWVSTSTTYPHVYPGNEPNDKLVILEDTDGDGKADKSSVFADDLHIPLSFEFGDGGVYVSDEPHLTFLKDTDGDGKADLRRKIWTGFGTEDSHHSLHDFAWTPAGDLIFRESIFHHSQVETPYGPVRQANSGWFRYEPKTHRLTSFGSYHSTNPWGVTFDDWGQHVASHPIYAAAFHSLDPPYPTQHPRPGGLQAYSGVCGHEFVDFDSWPKDLHGSMIKVRYKPTNRVEILKWKENDFGYEEEYVSDLIFSSNLSFIPVDLRYGPRGAMYICDWYNPVKGHAQYSLRDERRDRHSGRIWRIMPKGAKLQEPPKIAGATNAQLLEILKRKEYRYRYWAKREIRERDPVQFKQAIDAWVKQLDVQDPRFRHHQVEALWAYSNIGATNLKLLREVLHCDNHHARAAAVRQLRKWHSELPNVAQLIRHAANDKNGIVRMEAAIAASYVGTKAALDAMMDVFKHPAKKHLAYAITCALGSHTLKRHWEGNSEYDIEKLMKEAKRHLVIKEPNPTAQESQFDSQRNVKRVEVSCMAEKMLFTVTRFDVTPGQPVKLVFSNPDATDHNMVFVKPDALEEVGMAANEMARDPKNANSDFVPQTKRDLILHASPMIGPTRKSLVHVFRFEAPTEPGVYPYVCTFPGHWIIMKGDMVVANNRQEAEELIAARKPKIVKKWALAELTGLKADKTNQQVVMRGMQSFVKARCNQCHAVAGHGLNLGPDLTDVAKRYTGDKLLRQIVEPSTEINKKYQTYQFILKNGKLVAGVVTKETRSEYHIIANLLTPKVITKLRKRDVEERILSKTSSMPQGMLNVLTKQEIAELAAFLESGGLKLPEHLKHKHSHGDSK